MLFNTLLPELCLPAQIFYRLIDAAHRFKIKILAKRDRLVTLGSKGLSLKANKEI